MTLRSPAGSIAYALWLRSRLILASSLAGTFALCALAMALSPVPRVVAGMGAGLAFTSGLALLIGVVTYGGADLSAPESIYPKHAMIFPARTRTLVGVPMLIGTLTVTAYWLLVSGVAMAPVGLKLPVLWPAGMMAAVVAWLQAASWSPYRFPFLRVAVMLLILAVLIPIGVAGQLHGVHPAASAALGALVGALAYPVALIGVARARRGDGVQTNRSSEVAPSSRSRSAPAARFASPAAAQFWFDLVRNAWYQPVITALVELVLFTLFVGIRNARPNVLLPAWVPPGLVPVCALAAVPMFVVMVHAIVFGKFDMWTKSLEFPPFFLTRPVSTAAIVAAKLRAAAIVTLLVWSVAGLVIFTFVCIPRTYDGRQSWAAVLVRHATLRSAGAMAVGGLLLMIFTWSQIARALWISMSGKPWLVHGFPTASMLAWGALGWAGYRLHLHPTLWKSILEHAGLVLAAAVTLRSLVAIALLMHLVRRNLLRPTAALATLAAWLLTCALLFAAVLMLVEPLRRSPVWPAAIVALFIPLVRPALAILMLHHTRHR